MFDINNAFPSKYKKADQYPTPRNHTISGIAMEEVAPGESKPVLRFVGEEQGLVVNRTNATTLTSAYGKDAEQWIGREVMLFSTTVSFQGRMVPAIRVSAAQPAPQPAPTPVPQPAPAPQAAPQAAPQPAPVQQTLPTDPAPTEQPNDPIDW